MRFKYLFLFKVDEQNAFLNNNGISVCVNLLDFLLKSTQLQTQSLKTIINLISLIECACKNNSESCHFMLFSNKLTTIIDLLHVNLNTEIIPIEKQNKLVYNQISTCLVQLITSVFNCLYEKRNDDKENLVFNRSNDTIR
jgi:hypothetical protein